MSVKSIKDEIDNAKASATVGAIIKGLDKNRSEVTSLDKLVSSPCELGAVLTKNGDSSVLVLPVYTQNNVPLERSLIQGVRQNLAGYSTKSKEIGGYAAFSIDEKDKRLPRTINVKVGSLDFRIGIIREDVDLENAPKKSERRYFKKVEYESLPQSEWYNPPVSEGEEFVINSNSLSSRKYNLIALARTHSGSSVDNFPGFHVPFEVRYNGKSETTKRVASPKKSTKVGENKGAQFFLNKLMRKHEELRKACEYTFKVVEPGKVYEIISIK